MLVIGVYVAISERRGVSGWVLSIIVAAADGLAGSFVWSSVIEMMIPHLELKGFARSITAPDAVHRIRISVTGRSALLCSAFTLHAVMRFR